MKVVYFQMCNRVQAGMFMFYMIPQVSTKGSVLDLQVLNITKHIAPGDRQGLHLSYSVSARKPISSSPSSD